MTDATMTAITEPVQEWERGAWCLAALALASRDEGGALASAAVDVLEAAGLPVATLTTAPMTSAQIEALAS